MATTNYTTNSNTNRGLGFVGALTIAFIVLKLTNVISWPWIWVLSPLWISAGLTVAILVAVGLGFLVYLFVTRKKESK